MDSDAILTAVNAAESVTNPPHNRNEAATAPARPWSSSIHLIFLLCGIVAVAFVLLISIYLILSGLPAIRQIGLVQFLLGQGLGPDQHHHRRTVRHSAPSSSPPSTARPAPSSSACRWDLLTAVFLAKVAPPKAGGGHPHGGAACWRASPRWSTAWWA